MDSLKKELFAALKKQGDPRMSGNGDVFDHYPYADTTDRNFYERWKSGEKLKTGWVSPSDFDPGKASFYRDSAGRAR
jgi:hypothetical protein